jgi:hypothetical protein
VVDKSVAASEMCRKVRQRIHWRVQSSLLPSRSGGVVVNAFGNGSISAADGGVWVINREKIKSMAVIRGENNVQ